MRIVTLANTVLRLRFCASQVSRTLHQNSAYREESATHRREESLHFEIFYEIGTGYTPRRRYHRSGAFHYLALCTYILACHYFAENNRNNINAEYVATRKVSIVSEHCMALTKRTTSPSEPKEPLADASPSTSEELDLRYKPDWTPSWLKSKRLASSHEDYPALWNSEVINSVRIKDGRTVSLKRVADDSSELRIHRFLLEDERLKDPCNHTATLVDQFDDDDDDPTMIYMVMHLLRQYELPEFFAVEEVVDFMKQILGDVTFMHKSNVAHRDCSDLNIMMDTDKMFTKGFHPKATAKRDTVPRVRSSFIDFGISSMFGPEEKEAKVIELEDQDKAVPELSL
ncbi:hypothetical protein ACEPAF_100 [Sanghuangporus sanghuang]